MSDADSDKTFRYEDGTLHVVSKNEPSIALALQEDASSLLTVEYGGKHFLLFGAEGGPQYVVDDAHNVAAWNAETGPAPTSYPLENGDALIKALGNKLVEKAANATASEPAPSKDTASDIDNRPHGVLRTPGEVRGSDVPQGAIDSDSQPVNKFPPLESRARHTPLAKGRDWVGVVDNVVKVGGAILLGAATLLMTVLALRQPSHRPRYAVEADQELTQRLEENLAFLDDTTNPTPSRTAPSRTDNVEPKRSDQIEARINAEFANTEKSSAPAPELVLGTPKPFLYSTENITPTLPSRYTASLNPTNPTHKPNTQLGHATPTILPTQNNEALDPTYPTPPSVALDDKQPNNQPLADTTIPPLTIDSRSFTKVTHPLAIGPRRFSHANDIENTPTPPSVTMQITPHEETLSKPELGGRVTRPSLPSSAIALIQPNTDDTLSSLANHTSLTKASAIPIPATLSHAVRERVGARTPERYRTADIIIDTNVRPTHMDIDPLTRQDDAFSHPHRQNIAYTTLMPTHTAPNTTLNDSSPANDETHRQSTTSILSSSAQTTAHIQPTAPIATMDAALLEEPSRQPAISRDSSASDNNKPPWKMLTALAISATALIGGFLALNRGSKRISAPRFDNGTLYINDTAQPYMGSTERYLVYGKDTTHCYAVSADGRMYNAHMDDGRLMLHHSSAQQLQADTNDITETLRVKRTPSHPLNEARRQFSADLRESGLVKEKPDGTLQATNNRTLKTWTGRYEEDLQNQGLTLTRKPQGKHPLWDALSKTRRKFEYRIEQSATGPSR